MSVIRHRTKYRIISVGAASLVLPPCGPLAEQSGLQRSKLSRSSITTNPVVLSFVDASFLSVPLDLRPCQEPLHVSNGHWCLSSSRFYMAKHLWPGAHLTQSLDYACYSGLYYWSIILLLSLPSASSSIIFHFYLILFAMRNPSAARFGAIEENCGALYASDRPWPDLLVKLVDITVVACSTSLQSGSR